MIQVIRRVTLGIFLGGLALLAVLNQKLQSIPAIDALDPFGGLETLLKYVASGEFIKKIEPGNIVLLGAFTVMGVVLSRFFCGWFCVFRALQGVFGWLGKKISASNAVSPCRKNWTPSTTLAPADIAVDKPIRDMKDQYGYTMTTLKEKIKL